MLRKKTITPINSTVVKAVLKQQASSYSQISNQLFKNQNFISQFESLLFQLLQQKQNTSLISTSSNELSKRPQTIDFTSQGECEFMFQKATKRYIYPWNIGEKKPRNNQTTVECTQLTDQIADIITQIIDTNLHFILNKEFINVTSKVVAMRQEISIFTKQQMERNQANKIQVRRQLQYLKKKLSQQQHINNSIDNSPLQKFGRSKGILNSSMTKSKKVQYVDEVDAKHSIHHEIFELKKQIEQLSKQKQSKNVKSDKTILENLENRLSIVQQCVQQISLVTKLTLEQERQKTRKQHQSLLSEFRACSSKQQIKQQIKKTLRSHLKIFMDQLSKCKEDIQQLYQRIQKTDRGMQDYLGNQLKNVWMLVGGIKTRLQNIEQQCEVSMNQSFVL